MIQAIWNGVVLAKSDHTEQVEGNHYFPPDAINRQYFRASDRHTTAPGRASPATTTLWWTARKSATPPSTTRNRNRRPATFATT